MLRASLSARSPGAARDLIGAETAIIARCPSLIRGNTIVGGLVLNEAVAPCKVENNALTP